MIAVRFTLQCETDHGDEVVVVGNHPDLGKWKPGASKVKLATTDASYPSWSGQWNLGDAAGAKAQLVRFKFVVKRKDGTEDWETRIENRQLRVRGVWTQEVYTAQFNREPSSLKGKTALTSAAKEAMDEEINYHTIYWPKHTAWSVHSGGSNSSLGALEHDIATPLAACDTEQEEEVSKPPAYNPQQLYVSVTPIHSTGGSFGAEDEEAPPQAVTGGASPRLTSVPQGVLRAEGAVADAPSEEPLPLPQPHVLDGFWQPVGGGVFARLCGSNVRWHTGHKARVLKKTERKLTVELNGKKYRARLVDDHLVWSHGAVWNRKQPTEEELMDAATEVELQDMRASVLMGRPSPAHGAAPQRRRRIGMVFALALAAVVARRAIFAGGLLDELVEDLRPVTQAVRHLGGTIELAARRTTRRFAAAVMPKTRRSVAARRQPLPQD